MKMSEIIPHRNRGKSRLADSMCLRVTNDMRSQIENFAQKNGVPTGEAARYLLKEALREKA